MKAKLTTLLLSALDRAVADGELPEGDLPAWNLELTKNPDHGDYAANLAMVLAKRARRPPREVAEILRSRLTDSEGFLSGVEIAGPGFLNFRLEALAWARVLETIHKAGVEYGRGGVGRGRRVQVEFVSANPTGPLHVGHGRGAAVGDVTARILEAAGFEVEREYYVNDAGNQMRILGRSVWYRYRELAGDDVAFPDNHYRGDYVVDLARRVLDDHADRFLALPEDDAVAELGAWAGAEVLAGIREDLKAFGVVFDRWFSERILHDSGEVAATLECLEASGAAYRSEGALWLRTSDHGDEKDRVLIKGDGLLTYFAADIAYHLDKLSRGFDELVDVWGADHHGYIPRMKAALAAVGRDPDLLRVLLVQFVNLLRQGKPVGMSTRSGEFVTLREVVEEVGRDAARFWFLTRSCDTPVDFDLEVAKQQTTDNPVYYVQYAHTRVASLFRKARAEGVALPVFAETALDRLDRVEEREILKVLHRYPEVVEGAALAREPHRLAYFCQELAARFHSYYNRNRFIENDRALTGARMALADGVRQVIANALDLLGVTAPETM